MKKKVAIQGISGAFHEEAAALYYKDEDISLKECRSFSELIESVENDESNTGIMAVENSLAGSILPNFSLIENSELSITGEIYLRIIQNLVSNNTNIEDIKEVYSHPMAIYQCSEFFKKFPQIKLIESFDTALSAKEIANSGDGQTAAIASSFAAERYKLKVISKSIENNKLNYTRFFELRRDTTKHNYTVNKSSLCFNLPNKTGSLSGVLSIFAQYNMNLHKIQSYPIIGKPWRYSFYIDIVFDHYERFLQSVNAVKPLTNNLKILGIYKEGLKSLENIHHT